MNIAKEHRAIDAALDNYREQLDSFCYERFVETPPMGGWSYSEVYDHILKSSLGSGIALERCTHNNCPPTKKDLNFWGALPDANRPFPAWKIKVPESVAAKIAPNKLTRRKPKTY